MIRKDLRAPQVREKKRQVKVTFQIMELVQPLPQLSANVGVDADMSGEPSVSSGRMREVYDSEDDGTGANEATSNAQIEAFLSNAGSGKRQVYSPKSGDWITLTKDEVSGRYTNAN